MMRAAMGAFLVAILCAPGARADEAYEKEVRAAKEKLAVLLRKADELEAAGRREDAEHVRRQAADLRAEIAAFAKRHEAADRDVLKGLEQGIEALRKLGCEEEARRLEEIARDVRGGGDREKEILEGWIETMRFGVGVLAAGGKAEGAERLEQGVHAFRVAGRRDEEARRIRERAPGKGEMGEMLLVAAELCAHGGDNERAAVLGKLGREFVAASKKREGDGEREVVQRWIRLMRTAMEALAHAGRGELAERLEHGIHAFELALEGRRDEEAARIRESAPSRGEMGEILMAAADHLAHAGRREIAGQVDELGKHWLEQARRREAPRAEGDWARAMERIERLEQRMRGLENGLERIAGALRELNEQLEK